MYFDTHIFVCENVRKEGERASCGRRGGAELRALLKERVKAALPGRRIRVNMSGCLDRCEEGPVQVCYPEGRWFHLQTPEDVDRFIESYLKQGDERSVQDLRLSDLHPVDRHKQQRGATEDPG
jgi:(2Fe-2S) ferredoxin